MQQVQADLILIFLTNLATFDNHDTVKHVLYRKCSFCAEHSQ